MSLVELKDYHKEMALDEAILEYTRKELFEKFKDHISNASSLRRLMNDPLMVKYKNKLIEDRNKRVIKEKVEAEVKLRKALPDAAMKLIAVIKTGKRDSDVIKACVSILNMGGIRGDRDNMEEVKQIPHLFLSDPRFEKENIRDAEDKAG